MCGGTRERENAMSWHNQPTAKNLFRGRLTAAAIFLAAGAALAQAPRSAPTAGAEPTPMDNMDHGAMGRDMKGMDHAGGIIDLGGGMMRQILCGMTEHVESRLAYLKAELKLTDQQQAAWNTFADAYRATAQKTTEVCAAMDAAGPDHSMHQGVLGHLAMMEHYMSDHLDSVRGLKGAFEPLFAILNEEQKNAADDALMHVMGVGTGEMILSPEAAIAAASGPSYSQDQPAQSSAASYMPTVGDLMDQMQLRHLKLSYAGKLGNWKLANYEVGQIRGSFDAAARLYPMLDNFPFAKLVKDDGLRALTDVSKAIAAKNTKNFVTAFDRLTTACNSCHAATHVSFIKVRSPTASPFSNQFFPPERN